MHRHAYGTPTHLLPVVAAQPSEVTFMQVITSSEEPQEGAMAQCISTGTAVKATEQQIPPRTMKQGFSLRHLKCHRGGGILGN